MPDRDDVIGQWRDYAPTLFQTLKDYFEVDNFHTFNYTDLTSGALQDLKSIGAALLGHVQVVYYLTRPGTVPSQQDKNLLTWSVTRVLDALTHILADPPKPLSGSQNTRLTEGQYRTKALTVGVAGKYLHRATDKK